MAVSAGKRKGHDVGEQFSEVFTGRFVVGTRASKLAMWQARLVAGLVSSAFPALEVEIAARSTRGDRERDRSLSHIGGEGVFASDLEQALLAGECDCCVHSTKDLPTTLPEGLTIAAMPPRGDVRDALVAPGGVTLASLKPGARVGTGSMRRRAQLARMRPDLELVDIRGNLDTRVGFVTDGRLDAVVVAYAGLVRLGIAERATQVFDPCQMLPAAGQGAIAVEVRADDVRSLAVCSAIADGGTMRDALAERQVLASLGSGCQLPFGAYARVERAFSEGPPSQSATLRFGIDAVALSNSGSDAVRVHQSGEVQDAALVAARAARELIARGARTLTGAD